MKLKIFSLEVSGNVCHNNYLYIHKIKIVPTYTNQKIMTVKPYHKWNINKSDSFKEQDLIKTKVPSNL